jgi:hypothetical protein
MRVLAQKFYEYRFCCVFAHLEKDVTTGPLLKVGGKE